MNATLLYFTLSVYVLSWLLFCLKKPRRFGLSIHGLAIDGAVCLSLAGLTLHGVLIGQRWVELGHGPFLNLYEILHSNVWSITFVFVALACRSVMVWKLGRWMAIPMLVLLSWLMLTPEKTSHLPPTYNTVWLYVHVVFGKVFFGLLSVACASAFQALLLENGQPERASKWVFLAYKLTAYAFVFESLMLISGAIWAQDAWGRYWAWDPLETWAFMTWLTLLFFFHWHADPGRSRRISMSLIVAGYVIAFLTFFGVPYISSAPHKGMI